MIRALDDRDAAAYLALRREMLRTTPLAFASSPGDDPAATPDAVREMLGRAPDLVVFGAFEAHLVGAVAVMRDRHRKMAHTARVWGMYVAPERRCRGVGTELLAAAIGHARSLPGVDWLRLSATDAAPEARRMYERAGFLLWGTEPDALRSCGRSVVEHHLALDLRRPADDGGR